MTLEVEVIYEDGVLKLDRPLPIPEKQRLRVTIQLPTSRARQTAGLVSWHGSVEDLEYLAESPENSSWEGP